MRVSVPLLAPATATQPPPAARSTASAPTAQLAHRPPAGLDHPHEALGRARAPRPRRPRRRRRSRRPPPGSRRTPAADRAGSGRARRAPCRPPTGSARRRPAATGRRPSAAARRAARSPDRARRIAPRFGAATHTPSGVTTTLVGWPGSANRGRLRRHRRSSAMTTHGRGERRAPARRRRRRASRRSDGAGSDVGGVSVVSSTRQHAIPCHSLQHGAHWPCDQG